MATDEQIVTNLWNTLVSIHKLELTAESQAKGQRKNVKRANGRVTVSSTAEDCLVFKEKGLWKGSEKNQIQFTNIFQWELDRKAGIISLSHLRKGPKKPVMLVQFAPTDLKSLESIKPYICSRDSYSARIHFDYQSLSLEWKIKGPKKNETVIHSYSQK